MSRKIETSHVLIVLIFELGGLIAEVGYLCLWKYPQEVRIADRMFSAVRDASFTWANSVFKRGVILRKALKYTDFILL
jgi:hypothetical protein